MEHKQRGPGRAIHYHRQSRARRDPVRAEWPLSWLRRRRVRQPGRFCYCHLQVPRLPVRRSSSRSRLRQVPQSRRRHDGGHGADRRHAGPDDVRFSATTDQLQLGIDTHTFTQPYSYSCSWPSCAGSGLCHTVLASEGPALPSCFIMGIHYGEKRAGPLYQ